MTKIQELEELLKHDVIIDLEDYIDDLFEIVAKKKETEETKEELKNMQELKGDFEDMLEDIKKGDMDEEEAIEILEELHQMKVENEED
ncbi:MAG: hypothetical protein HRT42_03635 [Campylobacteraceae bacterium]|nr:hypothetical protein [Campylobacteraceae bacterium]